VSGLGREFASRKKMLFSVDFFVNHGALDTVETALSRSVTLASIHFVGIS
jgi:hypothetical protein